MCIFIQQKLFNFNVLFSNEIWRIDFIIVLVGRCVFLIVRFDMVYLPIIKTAGQITFTVYPYPGIALIAFVIMVIAFFNIKFQFETDLEGHPHPREITDIDSLNRSVHHLDSANAMNIPGIQIQRLPVRIYIFFRCLVQAVITLIFYTYSANERPVAIRNASYINITP